MAMDVQHSLEEDTAELTTTINPTPLVDVKTLWEHLLNESKSNRPMEKLLA